MKLLTTIEALRSHRQALEKTSIGFVPTMGALHSGHARLIQTSAQQNTHTIVSVFVNPTQFGPNEDFDRYPRTLEADIQLAEEAGAASFFAPDVTSMYPQPQSISMHESVFSKVMCGAQRPGHFDGVCLVVHKLLNLTQPTNAYFGQKDLQQLRVLKALVSQMHIPTQIHSVPTVRMPNGLAMSSRNRYLTEKQQFKAAGLYAALQDLMTRYTQGETDPFTLIQKTKQQILQEPDLKLEYVDLRQWSDFSVPSQAHDQCFVALAAKINDTRLIDNIFLSDFPFSV